MPALKAIAAEAVVVALLALAVALAANAVSPRGLRLGRDYFPRAESPPAVGAPRAVAPPAAAAVVAGATSPVVLRLAERGLRVASLAEASAWFRDASAGAGLVAFVDARDEAHFSAGHIPGAWPFDHYRPERALPAVLPACLAAQKIVVYCAGGACEDSEFAAVMLRDAGVPRESIFVFAGGIAEWTARALPLETGERGSGRVSP